MKRIVALTLVLLMILSLTACGKKTEPAGSTTPDSLAPSDVTTGDPAQPAQSDPSDNQAESTVCTPEDYDKAISALTVTTGDTLPTYAEVVALFGGVEGTINKDLVYEGYRYYNWTDGSRTALLTFKVSGETETYYAITGDIQ